MEILITKSVRLDQNCIDDIRKLAKQEKKTPSELIRLAIRHMVESLKPIKTKK